jgi:6-phosphogluconate dehydrogenase
MEIGVVGLGRMGLGVSRRLLDAGMRVEGFDLDPGALRSARALGVEVRESLEDLVLSLPAPRTVWLMLPAGEPVERTAEALGRSLERGDVLIDAGNSHYRDSIRRGRSFEQRGIDFFDVGTSGGVHGGEHGFCLMVGGAAERVERLRPVFEALAPGSDRGWGRVGSLGAGHFAKMVHNGIEYGLMQAYAEGFAILEAREDLGLEASRIADIWRSGSVVRSFLLDLTAELLDRPDELGELAPSVPDTGGGRWTVEEAIALDVPAPVITAALLQRLRSRSDGFAERLLAGLRGRFGGHAAARADGGDQ